MGIMRVNGGGPQVVQFRTASRHKSSRLSYNQSENLEVNDSGDQLWLDFCFFACGEPSAGPADVLPGDEAQAFAGLWKGIQLVVTRDGKVIYDNFRDR